jgi:hypothetical protein
MVLLVAAMPAMAQEDTYNAGMKAMNSGKVPEAQQAFCSIKGFKDADSLCAQMNEAMKAVISAHNKRYTDAIAARDAGDLDKAESLLKMVKYGTFVQQAANDLVAVQKLKQQKAADAAAQQQNANAAATSEAKFNEGVAKFAAGDVGAAKSAFEAVSGTRQAEAQGYLTRINTYNAKMSEGKSFENQGNFKAAASAYTAASLSVPTASEAGAAVQRVMNATGGSAPATNTAQQEVKAASKDVVKQIDVNSYLAQGRKLLAKGDFARARRFFGDVLAQDSNNKEAKDALTEIASKDTSKGAATDEDPTLAAALRTYYEGDYKAAEFRLDNYIYNTLGKKMGLANFYRGVLYLQNYYLGGEKDSQAYQEAVKRFKAAKAVDGFVPPEKYVSPRVIKVYKEAAGS